MGALERKKAARARHSTRISKPRSLEDCADRNMIENVCTPEQIARGGMQVVNLKMIETVVGGKVKTHVSKAIKNTNQSPVARWTKAGELDHRQQAAIEYYERNYNIAGTKQRTTANLGALAGGGGGAEENVSRVLNAKANLRLIDERVFFLRPAEERCVFEDVVLHFASAAEAGLWANDKAAPRREAAALQIVKSISHQIALCVIDGRGGQAVKDAA